MNRNAKSRAEVFWSPRTSSIAATIGASDTTRGACFLPRFDGGEGPPAREVAGPAREGAACSAPPAQRTRAPSCCCFSTPTRCSRAMPATCSPAALPGRKFKSERSGLRSTTAAAFCALARGSRGSIPSSRASADQGIAVRRSFYEQLGGFPPWPLFEDVEFLRRARRRTRVWSFPSPVKTSARRFQRRGATRQQLQNTMLLLRFLAGASPVRLAAEYRAEPHDQPRAVQSASDTGGRR